MELYKQYRPSTFKEMVGQKDALRFVYDAIKSGNLPQVLLLRGPSGCGKTTLARIIATKLNCHPMDVEEMNSSSYRGIDTVRNLERQARQASFGDAKVFVIDEVHKWTSDAQNAALKLLEDTPRGVYFLLCTTNPEKLINPIRTRCTDVVLSSLSDDELGGLLDTIAKGEGLEISELHRGSLIDAADGSARQLLVILDRVQHLPVDDWEESINEGVTDSSAETIELCRELLSDTPKWSKLVKILSSITGEPETIRRAVLAYASAVLLKSKGGNSKAYGVIANFATPFYDTGKPGLVASCHEIVFGD